VRSVNPTRPLGRAVTAACCVALVGGVAAGCSTTQEKAEHQAARAEHILNARAERQKAKKKQEAQGKHGHSGKGQKHGKDDKNSKGDK
jgi:hypothetical protein